MSTITTTNGYQDELRWPRQVGPHTTTTSPTDSPHDHGTPGVVPHRLRYHADDMDHDRYLRRYQRLVLKQKVVLSSPYHKEIPPSPQHTLHNLTTNPTNLLLHKNPSIKSRVTSPITCLLVFYYFLSFHPFLPRVLDVFYSKKVSFTSTLWCDRHTRRPLDSQLSDDTSRLKPVLPSCTPCLVFTW